MCHSISFLFPFQWTDYVCAVKCHRINIGFHVYHISFKTECIIYIQSLYYGLPKPHTRQASVFLIITLQYNKYIIAYRMWINHFWEHVVSSFFNAPVANWFNSVVDLYSVASLKSYCSDGSFKSLHCLLWKLNNRQMFWMLRRSKRYVVNLYFRSVLESILEQVQYSKAFKLSSFYLTDQIFTLNSTHPFGAKVDSTH